MQTYAKQIYEQYSTMSASELVDYYTAHPELIARLPKSERRRQGKSCIAASQENELPDTEEAMSVESVESGLLRTEASANQIRTIGLYYHSLRMGGVERVISLLIPVWLQAGYKVVLMTQEEPSSSDFDIPEETVRVVLPLDTSGLENRLAKFEEALLLHEIDLFIYHEWADYKMFPEMLLVKCHHIPFILYTHSLYSGLYGYLNDYTLHSHMIFSLCDKVLALSGVSHQFYKLCGCDSLLIQNPIEDKLKRVIAECSFDSCHKVVWIARFAEEKRPLDAIRVMKYVCEKVPDATLSMVGSGSKELMAQAQALCRELGIEKQLVFYGQQKDVSRFYEEAAVVLMTSEYEGYPNVIIEAKAYGKILAMYDLPYLTMIKSGLGLCTAKMGDVKGLAEEVVLLLKDVSLRRKLENESEKSFSEFRDYSQAELWNGIIREMEQPDPRVFSGESGVRQTLSAGSAFASNDGALMISLLLNDVNLAVKRAMKSVESYPDYKIGHALLKIPRMIKHLLKL